MNRYPIRPSRNKLVLDGSWKFTFLGDVDPESIDPESVDYNEIAAVPGCYDTAGETLGKRGVAVYSTRFEFPEGRARITFGGLGLYARFFLDGQLIKEMKTPYSTVKCDVCCTGNSHELTVVIDNRFDEKRVPLFKPYYDFYGYGGIYRSVKIESLPESFIERAAISSLSLETGLVRVKVKLGGKIPDRVILNHSFDRSASKAQNLAVENGCVTFNASIPDFKIWSPETPCLHTLRIETNDDIIVERFGLRTITTQKQDIILNGKHLYLLGVNRHEAHPQFGPVQSTQLMVDDIKWAKELGANFIRGAHYQQNPEFLELCDETGILVWNESLAWGLLDRDSENDNTVDLLSESTEIMASECANNPSVIICGFLNECNADTQSGRKMHIKMVESVRANNENCLVSYAGNRFEKDICTDIVDIISVNPYPGWISDLNNCADEYRTVIKPRFDSIAEYFSQDKFAEKPLLVSESGACGIFGKRDRCRAQWSEEFQADYFATAIRSVLGNKRYCGITLWQMFDCRSFVNSGSIRSKPMGYNYAGLLDEYRRPKLSYDEVKKIFEEFG